MTVPTQKDNLRTYLQRGRDALLWKLDGLSDHAVRVPVTQTGTNLLGIVKHVASVEAGYLGECFGRRFDEPMPWLDEDAEPNADMWATADESREYIVDLYRRVWAHSDETLDALELDAIGSVPWWPPERRNPTLGRVLIHMIAENERHAGHADIVRELIDGRVGLRADNANVAPGDAQWWADYRHRLAQVADGFR